MAIVEMLAGCLQMGAVEVGEVKGLELRKSRWTVKMGGLAVMWTEVGLPVKNPVRRSGEFLDNFPGL